MRARTVKWGDDIEGVESIPMTILLPPSVSDKEAADAIMDKMQAGEIPVRVLPDRDGNLVAIPHTHLDEVAETILDNIDRDIPGYRVKFERLCEILLEHGGESVTVPLWPVDALDALIEFGRFDRSTKRPSH